MKYQINKTKIITLVTTTFLFIPYIASATVFENPVGSGSIEDFVKSIIGFLASIAPIVALLALVYGGIRLAGASAISESEVSRAKQIILYAIIGRHDVITSTGKQPEPHFPQLCCPCSGFNLCRLSQCLV